MKTAAGARKTFSALALGTAAAVALGGCAGSGQGAKVDLGDGPAVAGEVKKDALKGINLTFSSWGGVYQDAQLSSLEDFEMTSGARVLGDGPTEYSKVKAQVDSGNVTWDVVDTDIIWAEMNCGEDGLFMDLDFDIIDTSNIEHEELVGDCYVPAMQYGYVIMYNVDKYPTAPTGWADFFDTKKFPGKRAIAGFEDVGPGVYEGALLAEGVSPDELYPLDMDRAYRKLDTIRDSLIYWKTGAESQQMIESGEADMALVWSGRGFTAVENGANYKPIWNQALLIADALGVPKGAKNPEAAMALINYYLGAESQAMVTEKTAYSPVHRDSKPQLSDLGKQYLITEPEISEQIVPTDSKWWAENYDAELDRWVKWLQG